MGPAARISRKTISAQKDESARTIIHCTCKSRRGLTPKRLQEDLQKNTPEPKELEKPTIDAKL